LRVSEFDWGCCSCISGLWWRGVVDEDLCMMVIYRLCRGVRRRGGRAERDRGVENQVKMGSVARVWFGRERG
jgi:hypothetical protein